MFVGIAQASANRQHFVGMDMFGYAIYAREGKRFFQNKRLEDSSGSWKNVTWGTGDVIDFVLDCDQVKCCL